MIKNIVFDNGGVIVKYSAETYLDYFKFTEDKQKDLDQLFASNEWTSFAKGDISSAEFKLYATNRFPEYYDDVLKILDVNNLKYMIPPYIETLEFIKKLKSNGYNIYLLTDINEDTIQYLKEEIEDFEVLFDGIVYSCRVGMVKKEGKVFSYLLDKFNLNPNETLFLDDSIKNLEEAEKFNIKTYRFLDPKIDIPNIVHYITLLSQTH
jgi:putative hydrolase of the HAD superfamily